MRRIIICCQGNIIRSFMAATIMAAKSPSCWVIRSAGVQVAIQDADADPRALAELARRGIVATRHRARQLVRSDGHDCDLVLCMDWRIRDRATAILGPARSCRVELFDPDGVPDPGGGGPEVFAILFERLASAAQRWESKLQADR